MRRITLYIISLILLVACDKEIDLGYRSIDAMYVVNSYSDESGSRVEISKTSGMYDAMDETLYAADEVKIISSDGSSDTLVRGEDGSYSSPNMHTSTAADYFMLGIKIGDDYFTSYSSVAEPPTAITTSFVVDVVMGLRGVSYRIEAERGELVNRYFRYQLYHDGEILATGVTMKYADDTSPISCSIFFAMDNEDRLVALVDENHEVKEGDEITCDFYALDYVGYQYFYTLSLSSQSSNNPVDNFSGGCLGYYTAFIRGTTLCDKMEL